MGNTRIEWAEKSWNPVTGCTKISPGCQNCYAERMSKRLRGRCGYPVEDPFRVTLHPERLEEPLRWRKPSMIFVCSMGDLFHEVVPKWMIWEVMDVILQAKQHTFLVLTKRPANMKRFYDWYYNGGGRTTEPPKNLWLGVTAENQEEADKRIPVLLQIPAAVRFVSVEPMLGPVDLTAVRLPVHLQPDWAYGMPYGITFDALQPNESHIYDSENHLDWVICGGETGPHARPMHPDWVRSLRDQCQSAGVPFFFKSWGEWACRPWSSDNGRKRELCLGMDGTSVYAQVGHMMGFRKPGEALMVRVGKKAAGRLLDGREWNEKPEVKS